MSQPLIVRHPTHAVKGIPECIQYGTHLSRKCLLFLLAADRGSIHSGLPWIFLPCTLRPPRPIRDPPSRIHPTDTIRIFLHIYGAQKKMVSSPPPHRSASLGGITSVGSGGDEWLNWKSMSHIQLHFGAVTNFICSHFTFVSWPFHYLSNLSR